MTMTTTMIGLPLALRIMFSQQLNVFFLLLPIAWVVGRTISPDLDEDCELNAVDTMNISYETDEEEQIYMFCAAECSFNNTEFVGRDRRSLNLFQVKENLENYLVNDADVSLLYDTYIKCDKNALSLMPHKGVKQLARRLSHPYPGLVFECVANKMILHCPAK
ncbi:hypothetical protein M5D96_010303 [Drosophila gunungcola]|uniref:Uncharacterized protein n=1 Tax=Drosophila gunungcola TaxID=103775 RepID=A0A9P9YHE7_9MUSC|nr:hypothetical protein M5D96_010303 [Drosophila gunungcola]